MPDVSRVLKDETGRGGKRGKDRSTTVLAGSNWSRSGKSKLLAIGKTKYPRNLLKTLRTLPRGYEGENRAWTTGSL